MAYDPADLRLPPWLLRLFDVIVRIKWPLGGSWQLRFTRPGALYLAALMGIWAAAFYSGNNLLYLCGAMLNAVALAAIWQGIRCLKASPNFAHLLPEYSEVGGIYALREQVNTEPCMVAWVDIEWAGDGENICLQWRNGDQGLVTGRLSATKRAIYLLKEQRLRTSAPLGLWELSCRRDQQAEWLVMPSAESWPFTTGGNGAERQVYEGDEWRDLRAYVPGDALSRVHWRKAAQSLSEWVIKRFDAVANDHVSDVLRVDLRLPAHADVQAFELMLGQAWFWLKEHRGQQLVLGQQSFQLSNPDVYWQACRALAQAQIETQAPLAAGGLLLSLSSS